MSYLHIRKGNEEKSFRLDDGKSGLLHRTVNLDTGVMRSIMGKQIWGKDIDPNGRLGKELMELSHVLWDRGE